MLSMSKKSRTNVYHKTTHRTGKNSKFISYTKLSDGEVAALSILSMIGSIIGAFIVGTKPTEEEVEATRIKEEARQASNKAGYSAVEAEANRDARIAEFEAELAKVIVKAKADSTNYKGQISKKFNIIPAKAKITKLTRGSKKLTVYYANQKASGVTSYKIAYKRSGAGWKYTTSKSTYKTIKGLKKGKKYYVRVQAIGSTGAGAWSDTKSIKVK